MNSNRNLRGNRKNRNCLQSLKVVTWNKVSGAIAIPKASWGCAPALPNWMQLVFLRRTCSLGKRSFASGKRGFHPCFCLPACCNCPVALSELTVLILVIQLYLNWTVSKNAIAAGKTDCKYNLLRKCGLLAHTSAAFLKNCCTEKLFNLPAA